MKLTFIPQNYLWICCLCLLLACTDNSLETPLKNQAGIEIHELDAMQGEVEVNGQSIFYRVASKDANTFNVKVKLAGQLLEGMVSYNQEALNLNGHGAILTEVQKEALLAASNRLFMYVNEQEGEVTYAEYSLIRLMEYWSRAPIGYIYGDLLVEAASSTATQRLGNEGITCIRKGTYVTAEYDQGTNGTRYSERIKVGSEAKPGWGCMGRCGADCGWGAPSAWTKDCMDHDQCGNRFNSSGGTSDSNCGDEFNEAADDWLFGVIRGCRG